MAISDVELMLQLKKGNASAFDTICERYKGRLIGVAYKYIGNRTAAEDLAADTLFALWKKRKSYQPKSKFSTFIFTILKRKTITYIRKHKETALNPEFEVADKKLSGLENVEIAEVREKVLGELNEAEQLLYRLKFIEGKSYYEISKILNVPIPVLRERWHRLLKKLGKLSEPYL